MSKELEVWKKLKKIKVAQTKYTDIDHAVVHLKLFELFPKEVDIIETALKVFEIIKEKKVNFYEIQFAENYEEYVKEFTSSHIRSIRTKYMLTQEEFVLLKEVLFNDF